MIVQIKFSEFIPAKIEVWRATKMEVIARYEIKAAD